MTRLRIVDPPEESWSAPPGDMWRCERGGAHAADAGRPACWVIVLPNGVGTWHTNMQLRDGSYWDVTGEPPDISVHPSIDADSGKDRKWHGWITNGEMSP